MFIWCFFLQVLEEYVKLFDMRDKTFVEALRAFLKEFRLPGEVGFCNGHLTRNGKVLLHFLPVVHSIGASASKPLYG